MKLIPLESLTIPPNRQRREFEPGAIVELANSICALGLFSPLVIRETNGETLLVAGERRYRAICHIFDMEDSFQFNGSPVPKWHIPVITLGDLTPLAAEEAEYEENVRREALTWQERAEAESRLHNLRVRQNPSHTIPDTAQEIHGRRDGYYQDTVRRNIIVARHLDDPDVARARTMDDAMKILKRKEDTARNVSLAESVGLTFSAQSHSVYNADAISWMANAAAGQFDVILTDPPYGMDAQDFGDGAGRLGSFTHGYDDSLDTWRTLMKNFIGQSWRVTKPQAHLYICCDIDRFYELRNMFIEVGFWVHRTPLINVKEAGGRVPWPENGPRRCWEMILFAVKGKKPVNMIAPDVITTRLTEETYNHGAQKPVDLYIDLLKRSVRPGDSVLDPFAGTGTILPAAHALKCRATVVELDPNYYGVCLKRLGELV